MHPGVQSRFIGRSCSKICLVNVYPVGRRSQSKRMYMIMDDQSNASLAKTEFFEYFGIQGLSEPYVLRRCAGTVKVTGWRAHSYVIEPLTGGLSIPLPTLIECNDVPNPREEIPTPEAASYHPHMWAAAREIPAMDDPAEI